MSDPELTVVIPTYNRLETLREVIPSLLRQDVSAQRYDIVVADSNSNDGTADYLATVARTDVRVRHLPGAYAGRAAARNAGIAAARGDLVLFTDADIIAAPDLLRHHLARHRADGDLAVVGMELQVGSFAEYERLRDHPAQRRPLHPPSRKRLSWLYFLTGNASVRKRDLERVGCFDESFTGYGHEDLELGYRLAHAGVTLFYQPRAVNYHWHPVPYDEQKSKMTLAGRSTVRFYRKHPHFTVRARLGMTPLSLSLHAVLRRTPALVNRLERAAAAKRGLARELVLQYHYLNGVTAALARERG
ncbi:MAG: glycosyltransferase family 2 protein [Candidatus Eremiobacteraeota bacterium]|nr:glycosyltransferase family 2 protein [Candidatus Eremiobacteraeota bacterium]MBC5804081.1 glycosyltransferase family 2 protein [Candidatus Eremiobacteraeota bacterium]MBC5821985.1 glycosyltransferase family 2 protein [Candidatus Eremiobacteraeota bacterium]